MLNTYGNTINNINELYCVDFENSCNMVYNHIKSKIKKE